jgi:zinc transporter, ZIP family
MEARAATRDETAGGRLPAWLLGLIPLLLIAGAVAAFALLDGPGLGDRTGPPVEELAVERTVLKPGEIKLSVRNDGPDEVTVSQVIVNDGFADFTTSKDSLGRLEKTDVAVRYPWTEGSAYNVRIVTSTGATIDHEIPVAVETPDSDLGFYGLMALLGFYVGVLPVTLGMLWLPFVRRIDPRWLRVLMALTIGLLGFLAIDATLEGLDVAAGGSQALGGTALVFVGGIMAYLVLTAVEAWLQDRKGGDRARTAGSHVALLVAIAIGLHNLGEGLAIGSAYAVGALALGAFLVIGFALHNTTEGLAIVAPVAARPPSLGRLALLGTVAGAPAILGAWIGASAFNSSVAALLLGAGAGAIVQVIQQLVPTIRENAGGVQRVLYPASVAGILAGFAILYVTSLLVSV